MEIIQTVGKIILVLPKPDEDHHKTESGLSVVDVILSKGVIVSVGNEVSDIYKEGDTVLFSKNAGTGQFYQGKAHQWIDGRGRPDGDVWAIIGEAKSKKDKGDSL